MPAMMDPRIHGGISTVSSPLTLPTQLRNNEQTLQAIGSADIRSLGQSELRCHGAAELQDSCVMLPGLWLPCTLLAEKDLRHMSQSCC